MSGEKLDSLRLSLEEFDKTVLDSLMSHNFDIYYSGMAIHGEFGEFLEKSLFYCYGSLSQYRNDDFRRTMASELGDVLWYYSSFCWGLNSNSFDVFYEHSLSNDFFDDEYDEKDKYKTLFSLPLEYFCINGSVFTGKILEELKKSIRNDKGVLLEKRKSVILESLGNLFFCLSCISAKIGYGSDLSKILKMNMKKVIDRKNRGVIASEGDVR